MRRAHPFAGGVMALLLVSSTSFASAAAATRSNVVRVNPFAQPLVMAPVAARSNVGTAPASASDQAPLKLRGVMEAGSESFANVGGVIVGLGEVVAGMRLRSVTESSAVFQRGDKKVVLEVSSGSGSAQQPVSSTAVPERALAGSTARELGE